jgi:poly(3-hydroxyalkanoate) synthetase
MDEFVNHKKAYTSDIKMNYLRAKYIAGIKLRHPFKMIFQKSLITPRILLFSNISIVKKLYTLNLRLLFF